MFLLFLNFDIFFGSFLALLFCVLSISAFFVSLTFFDFFRRFLPSFLSSPFPLFDVHASKSRAFSQNIVFVYIFRANILSLAACPCNGQSAAPLRRQSQKSNGPPLSKRNFFPPNAKTEATAKWSCQPRSFFCATIASKNRDPQTSQSHACLQRKQHVFCFSPYKQSFLVTLFSQQMWLHM